MTLTITGRRLDISSVAQNPKITFFISFTAIDLASAT